MIKWLLTTFDKHADDGFGAMATAFKNGADQLLSVKKDPLDHLELPTGFLLRHAAELFLKSALIVTHRRFIESDTYPTVAVDGKQKQLTNVHGLKVLYEALVSLLSQHRTQLDSVAKTAWLPMPAELDDAIAQIDAQDERSVFFRYPGKQGQAENDLKTTNRRLALEDLASWDREKQGNIKAFLLLNEHDEVVEAFNHSPEILAIEIGALKTACEWLECIHVGLRAELADGW